MGEKYRLEHIENTESLITLIAKLLEKIGFKDVKIVDQYSISAIEEGIVDNRPFKIFCFLSELNGKVPFVLETIQKNYKEDDNVIIISSNRKKIAQYFINWLKKSLATDKVDFWSANAASEAIDKYLPEYWGHNDVFLKAFEDAFIISTNGNSELNQVLKLDGKFEKLLNFFIEPKIYYLKESKETQRQIRVKFKVENYLTRGNYIITGDAGTGKTTLLKEIGRLAVKLNDIKEEKILPIRLKTNLIVSSNYSIGDAIVSEITDFVGKENYNKVFDDYRVLILLDSIDEFEVEKQNSILKELTNLTINENTNFILATRNHESLSKECNVPNHILTYISNFDLRQVKQYLTTFFKQDLKKSDELWDSLLENKILDKIPATPLTISLLSILYEENGYEVPATITDVYDNFNTFLLGRLNVNSNLGFLKISLKEKILEMYALDIIQTPNRSRKKKKDFINYLIDYFKAQSITIEEGVIPELIKGMTDGTGILNVDEQGFVTYQHDHFLEYYASREIFNSEDRAELEDEVIKKFTEYNWQNTAVFYTGRTKNMSKFLDKLVERIDEYKKLPDQLLSISGLGYVLQSLWMTDSKDRKKGVLKALDILIKVDTGVKQMAEQGFPFFSGIRDTDIALSNLGWFFLHYNSITLRDPLTLAFDELHNKTKLLRGSIFGSDLSTEYYKLFCIASTLNTGRVADNTRLDVLFNEDKILSIPLFVFLFNEAIELLEYSNQSQIRKDYKLENKKRKHYNGIRFLLDNKASDLRHTTFEKLQPIKNVELFTEGKTDASIISHAFRVCTMNEEPYWNITSTEDISSTKAGGAQQLAKHLVMLSKEIQTEADKSKTVIGIFDNDAKGFQEFNGGLDKNFVLINGIIKKHKAFNIYAILLPIPEDLIVFNQEKQAFKFFEIEHYFSKTFLEEQNMITETAIGGVYEVTGGKTKFNKHILNEVNPDLYCGFITLFEELDKICNKVINYIN
ncbi:NACHT domain-containing protein [Tenacibaculum retecalamus]|uniref:NACHT domain-containing protein n=1 Tax=Tenacibaculum retecalamus TaxID=3018315 RepID=UPI0023D8E6FF|nr:NACHT domain-containing protein [Tenacibaculum retecalamus]WBX70875.1 NACHT domain-containing protein [Tenacibaculum retecalamus]